jgi:hypothetical protein
LVLDVTTCPNLTELSCEGNVLTTLDISVCPNLKKIYCGNNQLANLDLSNCTALQSLCCNDNQLTNLDLRSCPLYDLDCWNNQLQLSDLFAASELVTTQSWKRLGTQNLLPQKANIGQVLFSEQSVFKNIYTKYIVTKDGISAPTDNYMVVDGKLIFNTVGNYTVIITNDAIVCSPEYPAKVIVDIEVGEVGIDEAPAADIRIYPNPTGGELIVNSYELRVESVDVLDFFGRKQKVESRKENEIDISHLPAGMYLVQIQTEQGTITQKIIKQ